MEPPFSCRPTLPALPAGRGRALPRAEIPETVTDQAGKIGERKRSPMPTEPGAGNSPAGRVPAGVVNREVLERPGWRAKLGRT